MTAAESRMLLLRVAHAHAYAHAELGLSVLMDLHGRVLSESLQEQLMTLHVSYIGARDCESNYSVEAQEPSIKESSTHKF